MTSLYSQYIKEREGLDSIEHDRGFVHYKLNEDCLFITSCYVVPKYRKSGVAKAFLKELTEICKIESLKEIVCTVWSNANGREIACLMLLNLGFKIKEISGELIVFSLEV